MGIAELLFPTFDQQKQLRFVEKATSSHANEPIYLNIMFYINLSFSFVSFELIFLPSTPITTPANIPSEHIRDGSFYSFNFAD